MPYTWLDDNAPSHPKVLQVGPIGFAALCYALCYANKYSTDGKLPDAYARNLPGIPHCTKVLRSLIEAGLMEKAAEGYRIVNFENGFEGIFGGNLTAKEVRDRRAAKSNRQWRWRQGQKAATQTGSENNDARSVSVDASTDTSRSTSRSTSGDACPSPSPVPSPSGASLDAPPPRQPQPITTEGEDAAAVVVVAVEPPSGSGSRRAARSGDNNDNDGGVSSSSSAADAELVRSIARQAGVRAMSQRDLVRCERIIARHLDRGLTWTDIEVEALKLADERANNRQGPTSLSTLDNWLAHANPPRPAGTLATSSYRRRREPDFPDPDQNGKYAHLFKIASDDPADADDDDTTTREEASSGVQAPAETRLYAPHDHDIATVLRAAHLAPADPANFEFVNDLMADLMNASRSVTVADLEAQAARWHAWPNASGEVDDLCAYLRRANANHLLEARANA